MAQHRRPSGVFALFGCYVVISFGVAGLMSRDLLEDARPR
jgi:hypothetical protein